MDEPLCSATDSSGLLHRYTDFPSQHVAPRHVDVWLPPGYADAAARYPVLYMHDGQNLFDPALAYTGIDWGIDESIVRHMAGGGRAAIVVGVWNTPERRREYMPQQPLTAPGPGPAAIAAAFEAEHAGLPCSDAYLRFLVEEVKPFIDANYRTQPARSDTFVMGSSMGGLISLYALCQHPASFGGAGCLSTHWPIGGDALVEGMAALVPPPGHHRIYFDYGTATVDAAYEPFQLAMDAHMLAAGYRRGVDWITLKFDGAAHTEAAWRARLDTPVRFLLVIEMRVGFLGRVPDARSHGHGMSGDGGCYVRCRERALRQRRMLGNRQQGASQIHHASRTHRPHARQLHAFALASGNQP